MGRRGRRAALPENDHQRLRPRTDDGLVVSHVNTRGVARHYDFARLPVAEPFQRSLAALFAARCVPEAWSAHGSSLSYWRELSTFAEFISDQAEPIVDLEDLTAGLIRRWRLALGPEKLRTLWFVCNLLRDDPRLQSGPVADELARRIHQPKSRVQSYETTELDRINEVARQIFRQALTRIERNARHLERWTGGEFDENSSDWLLGEALAVLARDGSMPEYRSKDRNARLLRRYRQACGGRSAAATWQRLFLTRFEATALAILLMVEFGWNLSVINNLKAPRADPDPGDQGTPTYRIELVKARRGSGRHHETRNVTDDGAKSAGRLIAQALQATRFARAVVSRLSPETDVLLTWRTGNRGWTRVWADYPQSVGVFRFGVSTMDAAALLKNNGLAAESPFQRGRRTVVAVNRREPAQHSETTYQQKYALPDRRVQRESVEVIASGIEDALQKARRVMLVAEMTGAPQTGDIETATADCSNPQASPFSEHSITCTASFLLCLACENAHIHPGHHPRLAYLYEAMRGLRSVLTPTTWATQWADHFMRLEELKSRLSEAIWSEAYKQVSESDRLVIDSLLKGELDL
jgi:hypothetical protein